MTRVYRGAFVLMAAVRLLLFPTVARADETVSGRVVDETGGAIPGVSVVLADSANHHSREATSDRLGHFVFQSVAAGEYTIKVELSGFQPFEQRLTLGTGAPPQIEIQLKVGFEEEVSVTGSSGAEAISPERNADALEIDPEMLRGLPIQADNLIPVIGNFISPAAGENPSFVLDGSQDGRLDVPAAAIYRVYLNKNPYSAEFSRPGKSRVEIVTQHGSRRYFHGAVTLFVRDSLFDARNVFATTTPDRDRRLFDGTFGGPLPGEGFSFFATGQRLIDNGSAVVNAHTPTGPVTANLATPERRTNAFARVDWRRRKRYDVSARYDLLDQAERNRGVGGFRLAEQAFATFERRHRLQLGAWTILSARLINELRIDFDRASRADGEAARSPAVVVAGAFIGGPSQTYRATHQRSASVQNIFTVSVPGHALRIGARYKPKRADAVEGSNFGGTFEFAGLEQFARATPLLFRINRGDPSIAYTRGDASAFVEDRMTFGRQVGVTLGLRYDWQSDVPDPNNLAPRVAVAFAPGNGRTVIRAGAGLFYEDLPDSALVRSRLLDGARVQEIVIANPSFPAAFLQGRPLALVPPTVVRIDPALETPYALQTTIGVERALWRKAFGTVEYQALRGAHLFRLRDINAPLSASAARPNPNFLGIHQVESTGLRRSHALVATFRGRIKEFKGTAQYTLSRTTDDTADIFDLPASSYALAAEWGRADFDRRHRFALAGAYEWPSQGVRVGSVVALASGVPFDITTGSDDNGDLVANDRPPGVTRNTGQGPGVAQIDLRLTKVFRARRPFDQGDPDWRKREQLENLEINLDAFNALNTANFNGYVGVLTSPFFGRPNAARPARTLQLSVKYRF